MKIYQQLLFLLFCFQNIFGGIPHLVSHRIYNGDGSSPQLETYSFVAFIEPRPKEILTDNDPGMSGFIEEPGSPKTMSLLVQVGDFPTAWKIGDILKVQIIELKTNKIRIVEVPLDEDAFQLVSPDKSMPVDLASFNAEIDEMNVRLSWTTKRELNNKGFFVFRKDQNSPEFQEISSFKSNIELTGQKDPNHAHNYHYVDRNVKLNQQYTYLLKSVDLHYFVYSYDSVRVHLNEVSSMKEENQLPTAFGIWQNYPNPFNPETKIKFSIPMKTNLGITKLFIIDILGKKIRTLVNYKLKPGEYEVTWNGKNDEGEIVPSGIYLYVFQNRYYQKTKKMSLIR